MILSIFKERKEAKIFEKNLQNKKVNLEFSEIIKSLKKLELDRTADYAPDKENIIRQINMASRIKRAPIKNRFILTPKLLNLATSLSIIILFFLGGLFYSRQYNNDNNVNNNTLVSISQNTIQNIDKTDLLVLDYYITKQKSNEALAAEVDHAFNEIPKINQNHKPFVYW